MPYGDAKHQQIYNALVELLGEDYVEDDPAIVEAFYRDYYSYVSVPTPRVEFWILPADTQQIQAVYRLANQLDFPTSVSSTGLLLTTCSAVDGYPYWCFIDPKRMNRILELDPRNMYAVIEPYVTIAQLQAESMKHGLMAGVTGAGSQASALATHLGANTQWTGWRTGRGRSLLGFEWVIPTGELVRTGSLAIDGSDYSWGEGPGLDAQGLWRSGALGPMGAFGMVTRAAVKLFPWPGPKSIPTEGVQPEKRSILPKDKFKSIILSFPSLESCIDAVRELGEAEVAGAMTQSSVMDLVMLASKSREEFWQKWQSPAWQKVIHHSHLVSLTLWAFAGTRQLEYEEQVVLEIARAYGGGPVDLPQSELDWCLDEFTSSAVRDSHRPRYMRLGPLGGTGGSCESLYDAVRSISEGIKIKAQFTPPMGDGGPWDMGAQNHKLWLADFGRIATSAVGAFGDKTAEFEKWLFTNVYTVVGKLGRENQIFSAMDAYDASLSGAKYGNIHLLIGSIKKDLDPKNIASPSRLVNMKTMEKMAASSPQK
jgi:hypothetical protein